MPATILQLIASRQNASFWKKGAQANPHRPARDLLFSRPPVTRAPLTPVIVLASDAHGNKVNAFQGEVSAALLAL
jgi:hypothetical protein